MEAIPEIPETGNVHYIRYQRFHYKAIVIEIVLMVPMDGSVIILCYKWNEKGTTLSVQF